jgi:hypothetical protein
VPVQYPGAIRLGLRLDWTKNDMAFTRRAFSTWKRQKSKFLSVTRSGKRALVY